MLRLSVYSPPLEGRRTAAGGGGVTAVSEDLASVNNHSVCGVSLPNGGANMPVACLRERMRGGEGWRICHLCRLQLIVMLL